MPGVEYDHLYRAMQLADTKVEYSCARASRAVYSLHVFDGLNHMQELTEINTVLPPVLAFLKVLGG